MAASRKDSRGYALRTGECQRKDGRYSFSYTDKNGKRHTIYEKDLIVGARIEVVQVRHGNFLTQKYNGKQMEEWTWLHSTQRNLKKRK